MSHTSTADDVAFQAIITNEELAELHVSLHDQRWLQALFKLAEELAYYFDLDSNTHHRSVSLAAVDDVGHMRGEYSYYPHSIDFEYDHEPALRTFDDLPTWFAGLPGFVGRGEV
jgi:hypothetical protein